MRLGESAALPVQSPLYPNALSWARPSCSTFVEDQVKATRLRAHCWLAKSPYQNSTALFLTGQSILPLLNVAGTCPLYPLKRLSTGSAPIQLTPRTISN